MNNYFDAPFSKNRAEEFGFDLWGNFVIPPYFDQLDLLVAKKPRVIISGRGCGKTYLLRYLSHASMFSPNRENINESELKHIGLYWRIDTYSASSMILRSIPDDVWESAFIHYSILVICNELISSIENIAKSSLKVFSLEQISKLDISLLRDIDEQIPLEFGELKKYLRTKLMQFHSWLNNVRNSDCPKFLSQEFLKELIVEIKQHPKLQEANFCIYIDEYENLLGYQKKIVNTWLKHSEMPLIYNLAMKRNSFDIKDTVGTEKLNNIHDYREHDLEEFYQEHDFNAFAAEILFFRLYNDGWKDLPIDINELKDSSKIKNRLDESYRKKIVTNANKIFPSLNRKELAKEAISNVGVLNNIHRQIKIALKNKSSQLNVEDFINHEFDEAKIVIPSLLYRKKTSPESVLNELKKLSQGQESDFITNKEWIKNNFYGCLLFLYDPLPTTCPIYAGYDIYCKMAHGNIRHLLELCHMAISNADLRKESNTKVVDINFQIEASKQASSFFLNEVKQFGRYGNKLNSFVQRLGHLFHLAQKSPTQSEPESTHFSILKGSAQNINDFNEFINEAIKYSVLFEEVATKNKNDSNSSNVEYILNPIYAPFFEISYRKGRKLELLASDFEAILNGEINEYEKILKKFNLKWNTKNNEQQMGNSLFELNNNEE